MHAMVLDLIGLRLSVPGSKYLSKGTASYVSILPFGVLKYWLADSPPAIYQFV